MVVMKMDEDSLDNDEGDKNNDDVLLRKKSKWWV